MATTAILSALAEEQAGLLERVQIDSAGTHGYHAGEPPDHRGRGGAALELVEVHHLEAVARARVVRGPLGRAHRGAQRQTADAAHAVDAYFHEVVVR